MSSSDHSSTPQLSSRPGYVLVRAALRVRQCYADTLAGTGLLPNQHAILSTLHELGPSHQKELALRVVIDPGDIVSYLDGLQQSQFIVRERDPADRRRQIVTITKAGRTKLIEADNALDEVEATIFASLTARDRTFLDKLSARIYDAAAEVSAAR
ncbi:DNA-binding MarR family transcriptional regulator [Rhodococcus sp. PvR044]|uniref:MarR family winged helix-turn-helix transcriptional regulator n=1 Tax=unclassified Rhodococcus (in: high G+C Gram-positive bacteria) TaxID=192944 RepID=UPI000BE2C991|nr:MULTISPECIES: MarR family transcriptional regulator [unclassified Rhodococcus (in: high G+C Gram-positive bacteria)]MBP1161920.1 DNA-binding MarR family transcriptional regulator [Rhodococcus sp. PvR099]